MGKNNMTKPILFTVDMVRAVLDDRKNQTRRTVKPQLKLERGCLSWSRDDGKRIPNGPRQCAGGSAVTATDLIGQ
jgi:hypothetical protein